MLQLTDTRITLARHANILPGIQILEEGLALVYVKDAAGNTCVQPSTGAANELFAGVSYERYAPARSLPFIREYELDATGSIQLPRVPAAGQISAIENGAALSITNGDEAPETGNNAVLDGDVLMFAPGDDAVGRVIRVQMSYVPDLDEARTLQGDAPFGGHASALTDVIGRLLNAEFATSAYDVTKDWTAVTQVALGEGGLFVPATSSNKLANVVVQNSPNGANPFLKLSINVA